MEESKELNEQVIPAVEKNKMKWWWDFWGIIRYPNKFFYKIDGRESLIIPVAMMVIGSAFSCVAVINSQHANLTADIQKNMVDIPPERVDST